MANTTAIIAALPSPMDRIRLVGDEEKHATLLFFGETASLPSDAKSVITDVLAKASRMLFPFREYVNDISRLGSDIPPALVAILSNQNLGSIRNALKLNSDIESYLENATQHPQFTPHVTLGYPDYAGEKELRDLARQLDSVNFDRLALWWNDERIEFQLGPVDLMLSEAKHFDSVDDILKHYGVKGMHWGVRRTRQQIDTASADAKTAMAIKDKGKTSGTNSLSNAELQTAISRMNLEQQYSRLLTQTTPKSKGRKFAEMLLGDATNIGRDIAKQEVSKVGKAATSLKVEEALKAHGREDIVARMNKKK